MTEVISIKFKSRGKVYFFDPAGIEIKTGDSVVVETAKGLEFGECVHGNHMVPPCHIVPPLRPVVRIATADDLRVSEINKKREQEAMAICKKKIAEHNLDMKLVDVECNFEGSKILFFFTSDGRVDFRELVKDLASIFRTRIELRQIGVRDEAKMLGGIGACGRPFCCSQFLDDFQPVSTKMAKVQSLSLNPTKISGSCGRLMCCLRYEQEAYEDLVKKVPKNGAYVQTVDGYGSVAQVNLLRQQVKVRLDGEGEPVLRAFDADDVAAVPGGRPKPGETPPDILKPRPKLEKDVTADEGGMPELIWKNPLFAASEAETGLPQAIPEIDGQERQAPKKKNSRRRSRGRSGKPQSEHNTESVPEKAADKPAQKPRPPKGEKAQGNRTPKPKRPKDAPPAEPTKSAGEQKSSSGRRRRPRKKPDSPAGNTSES